MSAPAAKRPSLPRLPDRLRSASPRQVATAILAIHAVWILIYLGVGHDIRDFIKIGKIFVTSSHASRVIKYDPHYHYPPNHDASLPNLGFDGQFTYYIALDPKRAHYYIASDDDASYRYQRILYPMLARLLSDARPSLIPWTMLLINWLAVAGGVLALGAWLRRQGVSSWWAALYGLYPGMVMALQRDLTEPLAYGLVAFAVYLFDYGGRRGVIWSGLAFGLAALARETTLLYAIAFALTILFARPRSTDRSAAAPYRRRQVVPFALLAFLPVAAWTIFLWSWLGLPRAGASDLGAPFMGPFEGSFDLLRQPVDFVFVAVPALLVTAVAVASRRDSAGDTERLCLLVNVLFIIILSSGAVWGAYSSIGRVSIAIVLAALLCLPLLVRARARLARVSAAALGASLCLGFCLFPFIVYYGFSNLKIH